MILVSRRRGLYQASIPSKIACDSWTFVSHRWVSRTSRYIVDQNDSIIALSTEATRPIEPGSLAWRSRCPNAQEVYCPGCHDRSCLATVAVANTPSAGHRRPSWCVRGRRLTSPQSSANTHRISEHVAVALRFDAIPQTASGLGTRRTLQINSKGEVQAVPTSRAREYARSRCTTGTSTREQEVHRSSILCRRNPTTRSARQIRSRSIPRRSPSSRGCLTSRVPSSLTAMPPVWSPTP